MPTSIAVSVIVPIYQVEQWLKDSLQSLVQQTLPQLEVLLINDGSTDRSKEIAQQFCQHYPERFKLIDLPENRGVSNARNIGLAHATGEYVGFVDGDDFVESEMFEQLYRAAKQLDCDWVGCQMCQFDTLLPDSSEPFDLYEHYDDTYITNKIFKRCWIETLQLRFYSNVIFEDEPFVYLARFYARQSAQLHQRFYHYRMNPEGACRNPEKTRFNLYDKQLMLTRFLADLNRRHLLIPNREIVMQCLANHALSALYYSNSTADKKGFFSFLFYLASKYRLSGLHSQNLDYKVSRFHRFSQSPWQFQCVIWWLPIKHWMKRLHSIFIDFRLQENRS